MLPSSTSAIGYLSQGYDGMVNSELLATGQLYTESWDQKLKLANEKKLKAQTYQMYARAGIIAAVALAVFMTFAFGVLAGVTMGIFASIPYLALRKAQEDEKHHMEPVRQERVILGNIYNIMAQYMMSCQEGSEKSFSSSPYRFRSKNSSEEEEEYVRVARQIKNMVNPIEFAPEEYQIYRYVNGSVSGEQHYSPWEHLQAVCQTVVSKADSKGRSPYSHSNSR